MKSQTISYSQFFSVFIITLIMTLASCSVSKHPKQDSSVNNQLGGAIQAHLAASNISSEIELSNALSKMKLSKADKVVVSKHKANIISLYRTDTLLLVKQNKYRDNKLAESLAENNDTPSAISTLVKLFPIHAYRILTYVSENNLISEDKLLAVAIGNNLDPTIVLEASAIGTENRVTPLIHSAGIVIYGQVEDNSSEVMYRKVGDNTWLPALELAWEPIYGALSGSIVHLNADTEYEVEVKITDYYGYAQEYSFNFKTRPNSPPIDPTKIYYLSEIYSGGQLDLEALNIYGSEDGYAKIIGDGQTIDAGDEFLSAVNIGSQAYIMLENLTIKGGKRYGVFSKNTHNIWIKGCDISEYGRVATVYKGGKGYASESSTSPINYDSGIYLEKTGVSVIEECDIHSPNGKANHWGDGHPNGPNALQVWAYHPDTEYRGQMVVRYNRFFGEDTHRFNDVIEGRKNFERTGGFVRDSAIYGNYLAYANDDLIEIDGGQQNVLVYNNEMTQGYAGISIAPNMLGPSYLFHNYVHDLGDERGKEWTAVKAGGLISKPAGKTFVFENFIHTNRNGLAASGVNGDGSFWVHLRNNIIITRYKNNMVGYAVYDKEKLDYSEYHNNIFFNTQVNRPILDVDLTKLIEHELTYDTDFIEALPNMGMVTLPIEDKDLIKNFSIPTSVDLPPNSPKKMGTQRVIIERAKLSKFSNQAKHGTVEVPSNSEILLEGNVWYKIPFDMEIDENSRLSFEFELTGDIEIAGIGLETNNTLTEKRVFSFAGSQSYGNKVNTLSGVGNEKVSTIAVGKYGFKSINYIVFILDNDVDKAVSNGKLLFKNLVFSNEIEEQTLTPSAGESISVGINSRYY